MQPANIHLASNFINESISDQHFYVFTSIKSNL